MAENLGTFTYNMKMKNWMNKLSFGEFTIPKGDIKKIKILKKDSKSILKKYSKSSSNFKDFVILKENIV